MPLGNLIAAGSSLLGGLFGNKSAAKQQKQNIAQQKEFAQSGIQWRVEDAKKAGIHPLYALGAQTHSFAPNPVFDSMGPALASAGQDIGRAVSATQSHQGRADAYTTAVQDLSLTRMGLENELLSSQIAKINQAGVPPAMSGPGDSGIIPGQGDVSFVLPSGSGSTRRGPGESHRVLEDEYGEVAEGEGAFRYVRDRAVPVITETSRGGYLDTLLPAMRVLRYLQSLPAPRRGRSNFGPMP